jgi:hypothetical protein
MTAHTGRLLLVPGSLDPADRTTRLLAATTTLVSPFAEVRWADLGALPAYDTATPATPAVEAFLADLAWADALLLGSPEFHGAIGGRMKSALDWAATAPERPLATRPVALVLDGEPHRSPAPYRLLLRTIEATLIEPVLYTPDEDGFADSLLVDAASRRLLTLVLERLAAAATR